jgi:hypothetical protein
MYVCMLGSYHSLKQPLQQLQSPLLQQCFLLPLERGALMQAPTQPFLDAYECLLKLFGLSDQWERECVTVLHLFEYARLCVYVCTSGCVDMCTCFVFIDQWELESVVPVLHLFEYARLWVRGCVRVYVRRFRRIYNIICLTRETAQGYIYIYIYIYIKLMYVCARVP